MLDQTSRIGCECVIAGGVPEWCDRHAIELCVAEATGGFELDRLPLADMGFGIVYQHGASHREKQAWHRTDVHLSITPRNKAPDRSGRPVALGHVDPPEPVGTRIVDVVAGGAFVFGPVYTAEAETALSAHVESLRRAYEAARAAKREERARHTAEPTTRAGRAVSRAAGRGKRRTAAEVARHNSAHEPDAVVSAERLTRLAAALAVVGDSWADRQG